MVEMELREIQISHVSPHQIIVLEEKDGARSFPIFIGLYEASQADDAVRRRKAARPLTHDLILNVIEGMNGALEGVVVDSLTNDTFHGKLMVRLETGEMVKIDCRPSDAVVLSAKADVPIFVADDVLDHVMNEDE
ncbi:MAG: bifunctional nuclease family protein [Sumerlaeia bacterium]